MERKNKILSLLLGSAVGDALGVPYEFKARGTFNCSGMTGYGTYDKPEGTWSDDTSLTLCLAEQIAEGFNLKHLGDKFVNWLENGYMTADGEVFDVGIGTQQAIMNIAYNACEPKDAGSKDIHNNGNGSLMRIAPLVFLVKDLPEAEIKKYVTEVSSMTHGHHIAVECCYVYIMLLRALIDGRKKENAWKAIKFLGAPFVEEQSERTVKSDGYVVDTLNASLFCFMTTDNYKDAVLKAVNLGEDTDTVACITGALAGLYYGVESIPKEWIDKLVKKDLFYQIAEKMDKAL